MTIRRRLIVAFVTILALFATNEAFHVWSARLRARAIDSLDRALKRQVVVSSIHERIENLQKQVSLLGQMDAAGDVPEARRTFGEELDAVTADITTLESLSDRDQLAAVGDLQATYAKLADSWRQFYDYLAVEQAWALAFQVRAEPMSRRVLAQLLPDLVKQQNTRAAAAESAFAAVSRMTQTVSGIIFAVTMVVALGVAYLMSRRLTTDLGELRLGAAMFGTMHLEHRIPVRTRDEIGIVATAFNEMAGELAHAQAELTSANDALVARNGEIERERRTSHALLTNILPEPVAAELAAEGKVAPRYFEDVTILFTDFVGFTLATERLAAEQLVDVLHGYFTDFDEIVARYGLEKMKTIGDSYFCAGGIPVRTPSHPVDAVLAGFEMIDAVARRAAARPEAGWSVRIGIHTGPVIAGVVGIRKFAFDIWGDTVNYASRMESGGAPNRINISSATLRRVKDFFDVEHRGKIATKEKRELDMYFVNAVLPALLGGADEVPPPAFARRYRTYFEKDPPAFPPTLAASRVRRVS